MFGILLIDKPAGITSHDVVSKMRRRFQTKRVGHAGTLDPIATGLLVIAIGPATRFLQYLPLEPKVYEVEFEFGVETTTYDTEGAIMARRACPPELDQAIAQNLGQFRGSIQQLAPMYSAVKKDGKALYEYARQGIEVERKPRQVYVSRFAQLPGGEENFRRFEIECSGGTYVRTLGHDLGQAIGCGAHVSELRRTQVGRFHVDQSTTIEDASPEHLIPLRASLSPLSMIALNDLDVRRVREGQTIPVHTENIEDRMAALLDSNGEVFSIARLDRDRARPECVIPAEAMNG